MPTIQNQYTVTPTGNNIHLKVEVEGMSPAVVKKTIAFLPMAHTGVELIANGVQLRCGETIIPVDLTLKSNNKVDSWGAETDKAACLSYLMSQI